MGKIFYLMVKQITFSRGGPSRQQFYWNVGWLTYFMGGSRVGNYVGVYRLETYSMSGKLFYGGIGWASFYSEAIFFWESLVGKTIL